MLVSLRVENWMKSVYDCSVGYLGNGITVALIGKGRLSEEEDAEGREGRKRIFSSDDARLMYMHVQVSYHIVSSHHLTRVRQCFTDGGRKMEIVRNIRNNSSWRSASVSYRRHCHPDATLEKKMLDVGNPIPVISKIPTAQR